MGGQKSVRRSARARQVEGFSNFSTFSGGARISRASLLAAASLVALATLGAPGAARACDGAEPDHFLSFDPWPDLRHWRKHHDRQRRKRRRRPPRRLRPTLRDRRPEQQRRDRRRGGRFGRPGRNRARANSGQTINLLSNATGATISGGGGGTGPFNAARRGGRRGRVEFRHGHDADQPRRHRRRGRRNSRQPQGSSTFLGGGAGGAGLSNAGTLATLTNAARSAAETAEAGPTAWVLTWAGAARASRTHKARRSARLSTRRPEPSAAETAAQACRTPGRSSG